MRYFDKAKARIFRQVQSLKGNLVVLPENVNLRTVSICFATMFFCLMVINTTLTNKALNQQRMAANDIRTLVLTMDNQGAMLEILKIELNNKSTADLKVSNNKIEHKIQLLSKAIEAIGDDVRSKSAPVPIEEIHKVINKEVQKLSDDLSESVRLESNEDTVSVNVLPFEIISIDYWNGTPKVAVRMDGDDALMSKNSERAGWTLKNIDMDSRLVQFQYRNQNITEHRVG
jgi:membrane-associated HD superfamily phosphohydrolase